MMRLGVKCAAIAAWMVALASGGAGAGPLDPPAGPIAPTGKTLGEVEPRVAINAINTPGDADSIYKITLNGSYYLTDDMVVTEAGQVAIEITGQNVTIDLSGFTIRGFVTGTVDGIAATSTNVRNVTIVNGCVADFPGDGIDLTIMTAGGVRIANVHAYSNGENGIAVAERAVIESCTATGNTLDGIRSYGDASIRSCASHENGRHGFTVGIAVGDGANSSIESCSAKGNGSNGFACNEGATLSGCVASHNGQDGFGLLGKCLATECVARENGRDGFTSEVGGNGHPGQHISACIASNNVGNGIYLDEGYGTVERCQINANGLDGIRVGSRARVVGNNCVENSILASNGAGIHITGQRCHVEGNTLTRNFRGIDVDTANNIVIGNRLAENTTHFTVVANNKVGVIVTAPNSGAINGSTGGAGMGSTDPSANVVY